MFLRFGSDILLIPDTELDNMGYKKQRFCRNAKAWTRAHLKSDFLVFELSLQVYEYILHFVTSTPHRKYVTKKAQQQEYVPNEVFGKLL